MCENESVHTARHVDVGEKQLNSPGAGLQDRKRARGAIRFQDFEPLPGKRFNHQRTDVRLVLCDDDDFYSGLLGFHYLQTRSATASSAQFTSNVE